MSRTATQRVAGDFSFAWSRRLGGEAERDAADGPQDDFRRALAIGNFPDVLFAASRDR